MLSLSLTACTLFPGAPDPPPSSGSASTSDGFAGEDEKGPRSTTVPGLPSHETLTWVTPQGGTYQVDVNSVEVRGKHTYFLFTLTHLKAAPDNPDTRWTIGDFFASTAGTRPSDSSGNRVDDQGMNANSANGLTLIDPETEKKWEVVYDTSGLCLCSPALDNISLPEGESHTLYAIYPALPDTTEFVSIEIPEFGRTKNIPVTRK
ncbi:MAG: hypothetical protein Q4C87_00680 [Actinomycetaceae bacterium]|nr:hypothetical protein [Actinomycetaceae bacterium]